MKEDAGTDHLKPALDNLEKAFASLESFLDEKVSSDRDRAGVIQAFEFTFELCWKTLQKLAAAEGLRAPSPKQALKAAFRLGLVKESEEELWLSMLGDRNLSSHTYRREVAEEIFRRVRDEYRPAIGRLIKAVKKSP